MKKCYTKLYLFLPLFIFCFALLKYSNVNAATYSITSGTLYRAFSACPSQGSCTFTSNSSSFSTTPTSALQSRDNNLRYLNGLFTSGNIQQGSSSNSVNSINNIVFGFNQDDNSSTYYVCPNLEAMWNYGQTDDTMKPRLRLYNGSTLLNVQYPMSVTCNEIQNVGIVEIYVTFSGFSTTNNTPINAFDFKWGDINTPTQPFPSITGIKASNGVPSSTFAGSVNYLGMSYEYTTSNDPDAAYQSTIINQNNTMINQNQQIINNQNAQAQQDQEDRDNISDSKDDGDDASNDAQTDSEQAMSNFFGVINLFIGALQTPATDCKVRSDLGHIDLGVLDFCSGKPNEFIPIIRVAILLVMAIPVYLICRRIIDDFINITVFAQGGK